MMYNYLKYYYVAKTEAGLDIDLYEYADNCLLPA